MFTEVVYLAFEDMFRYLGVEITYQPRNSESFPLVGVLKNPENTYDLGRNEVVGQVISIMLKANDVKPKIGDKIILNSKVYKIYKEPLLDGYDYLWKIEAVLI